MKYSPRYPAAHIDAQIQLWGSDHWATLLYIYSRIGHNNRINNAHMRCDHTLHPEFRHFVRTDNSPTHLNTGIVVYDHDDWSCVQDMVHYGLVDLHWNGVSQAQAFLTESGMHIAIQLKDHKDNGKLYKNFEPSLVIGSGT